MRKVTTMLSLLDLLKYAVPAVLVISLLEAIVLLGLSAAGRSGTPYNWREAGVSVIDLLIRQYGLVFLFSISAPVYAIAARHLLWHWPLDSAGSILALMLAIEFCYYWYHRTAHRVRWFWASHSVHHSPNQLNLATSYRLGWTGKLTGTGLFYTPLVWLGVPPRLVAGMVTLNLLYQFWLHATWIPKLGWLEYIFNTPSAHRVHHAANAEYLDANYGGILIIFDRLFGTYVAERADLPPRYGLVEPVRGHNLLKIEFEPWLKLWRDMRAAPNWRVALSYLVKPPGWRAEGAR